MTHCRPAKNPAWFPLSTFPAAFRTAVLPERPCRFCTDADRRRFFGARCQAYQSGRTSPSCSARPRIARAPNARRSQRPAKAQRARALSSTASSPKELLHSGRKSNRQFAACACLRDARGGMLFGNLPWQPEGKGGTLAVFTCDRQVASHHLAKPA